MNNIELANHSITPELLTSLISKFVIETNIYFSKLHSIIRIGNTTSTEYESMLLKFSSLELEAKSFKDTAISFSMDTEHIFPLLDDIINELSAFKSSLMSDAVFKSTLYADENNTAHTIFLKSVSDYYDICIHNPCRIILDIHEDTINTAAQIYADSIIGSTFKYYELKKDYVTGSSSINIKTFDSKIAFLNSFYAYTHDMRVMHDMFFKDTIIELNKNRIVISNKISELDDIIGKAEADSYNVFNRMLVSIESLEFIIDEIYNTVENAILWLDTNSIISYTMYYPTYLVSIARFEKLKNTNLTYPLSETLKNNIDFKNAIATFKFLVQKLERVAITEIPDTIISTNIKTVAELISRLMVELKLPIEFTTTYGTDYDTTITKRFEFYETYLFMTFIKSYYIKLINKNVMFNGFTLDQIVNIEAFAEFKELRDLITQELNDFDKKMEIPLDGLDPHALLSYISDLEDDLKTLELNLFSFYQNVSEKIDGMIKVSIFDYIDKLTVILHKKFNAFSNSVHNAINSVSSETNIHLEHISNVSSIIDSFTLIVSYLTKEPTCFSAAYIKSHNSKLQIHLEKFKGYYYSADFGNANNMMSAFDHNTNQFIITMMNDLISMFTNFKSFSISTTSTIVDTFTPESLSLSMRKLEIAISFAYSYFQQIDPSNKIMLSQESESRIKYTNEMYINNYYRYAIQLYLNEMSNNTISTHTPFAKTIKYTSTTDMFKYLNQSSVLKSFLTKIISYHTDTTGEYYNLSVMDNNNWIPTVTSFVTNNSLVQLLSDFNAHTLKLKQIATLIIKHDYTLGGMELSSYPQNDVELLVIPYVEKVSEFKHNIQKINAIIEYTKFEYNSSQIVNNKIDMMATFEKETEYVQITKSTPEVLEVTGQSPLQVNFSIGSEEQNKIGSIEWIFGDGVRDHTTNPSHIFSELGTYVVTCRIIFDDGTSMSKDAKVIVTTPYQNDTYSVQPVKFFPSRVNDGLKMALYFKFDDTGLYPIDPTSGTATPKNTVLKEAEFKITFAPISEGRTTVSIDKSNGMVGLLRTNINSKLHELNNLENFNITATQIQIIVGDKLLIKTTNNAYAVVEILSIELDKESGEFYIEANVYVQYGRDINGKFLTSMYPERNNITTRRIDMVFVNTVNKNHQDILEFLNFESDIKASLDRVIDLEEKEKLSHKLRTTYEKYKGLGVVDFMTMISTKIKIIDIEIQRNRTTIVNSFNKILIGPDESNEFMEMIQPLNTRMEHTGVEISLWALEYKKQTYEMILHTHKKLLLDKYINKVDDIGPLRTKLYNLLLLNGINLISTVVDISSPMTDNRKPIYNIVTGNIDYIPDSDNDIFLFKQYLKYGRPFKYDEDGFVSEVTRNITELYYSRFNKMPTLTLEEKNSLSIAINEFELRVTQALDTFYALSID